MTAKEVFGLLSSMILGLGWGLAMRGTLATPDPVEQSCAIALVAISVYMERFFAR